MCSKLGTCSKSEFYHDLPGFVFKTTNSNLQPNQTKRKFPFRSLTLCQLHFGSFRFIRKSKLFLLGVKGFVEKALFPSHKMLKSYLLAIYNVLKSLSLGVSNWLEN
uniref:Uncharacterized protein n=1 Tax=Romanomermis culicivorax TaxID=13658 RepID=A0A915K8B3_ROMCU